MHMFKPGSLHSIREMRSLVTSSNEWEVKTKTDSLQKQPFEAKALKKDLKEGLGLDLYHNIRVSRKERK